MSAAQRGRFGLWVAVLASLTVIVFVASVRTGTTGAVADVGSCVRGVLAALGLAAPLSPSEQLIVELRTWRASTASGVGAALALAGALVQGVFRNALASPSVLGITGGAGIGAVLALLWLGGYGARLVTAPGAGTSTLIAIPALALVGALLVAFVVYRLASRDGRVSIPTLLLIGLAANTFLGGLQQLLQMLVVRDGDVTRGILLWTFGTLDDRQAWHAAVAWSGVLASVVVIPFVAWELDLMQPGIEDAEALGVPTGRVKFLALSAASLATATSVAVAGQIAFVGLVVPHLVRLVTGPSHRTLLPLSALSGACFLLACDLASRVVAPGLALQPGVVMSLVGGPFFVWLLWRKRREMATW